MMEQKKLTRLSNLFEKVMANNANVIERRELSALYQEYINDGRDNRHQIRQPTNYLHATG